ncbi:MAG: asparagine synthase-related protein, partial [Thermodesulfobacteriota bacterium]|nr:asparagine synthase-related protein [Thermodesulfobacteriota bacterium]
QSLFVARDPIGIKPLYYSETQEALLFASELKALAPFCHTIREFPPGTSFHSQSGFSTFYTIPETIPQDAPINTYCKRVRETLEKAVVKRLMSDVPLGAFLSGGLDSSIIAALAKQHIDELHTFSVGIEGSNDLQAARLVSRHLNTVHHEYIITPEEVIENLPKIIYHLESFDQDLVRSAIPCYFTSRLASDYVKVILTGEGADEIFAGYTYYKDINNFNSLHKELHRSIASLHNINLQRVDRMTMAHSIEGRVPFLDLEMIRLGQLIPIPLKLSGTPPIEKWILRKAFEELLPNEIVWRAKEQFDEGSGIIDLLYETLKTIMPAEEARAYHPCYPDIHLRSAEECHYHRLFMEVFKNPSSLLTTVGRWSNRPS